MDINTFPRLDDRLTRLAQSRKDIDIQKGRVAKFEADITETEAYSNLQIAKEQLTQLLESAKEHDEFIRETALSYYDLDEAKNKSINDFVSIAEYTTFEINNELAISWASEHHRKALKLNTTEIKKVAKAGMEIYGVVMGKENRVKIASDLSQYIESQA